MHKKWENITSLADYAVMSMYEALKIAVRHDSNRCNIIRRCSLTLPFTSGRKTCPDPDNPKVLAFPKGEDITTPKRDVTDAFGLTREEMVSLMGMLRTMLLTSYTYLD